MKDRTDSDNPMSEEQSIRFAEKVLFIVREAAQRAMKDDDLCEMGYELGIDAMLLSDKYLTSGIGELVVIAMFSALDQVEKGEESGRQLED